METVNDILFRHSIRSMDTGHMVCLYNHAVDGTDIPKITTNGDGWALDDGKVKVPLTPTEVKIQIYTKGLRLMKGAYTASVSDPEALELFAYTLHEDNRFRGIPTVEFIDKVESLCEQDRQITFDQLVKQLKTWKNIP